MKPPMVGIPRLKFPQESKPGKSSLRRNSRAPCAKVLSAVHIETLCAVGGERLGAGQACSAFCQSVSVSRLGDVSPACAVSSREFRPWHVLATRRGCGRLALGVGLSKALLTTAGPGRLPGQHAPVGYNVPENLSLQSRVPESAGTHESCRGDGGVARPARRPCQRREPSFGGLGGEPCGLKYICACRRPAHPRGRPPEPSMHVVSQ